MPALVPLLPLILTARLSEYCGSTTYVDLRGDACVVCDVQGLAGAKQRVRRYPGPVRALAADELALDERDA
jgi:hypothetical protein